MLKGFLIFIGFFLVFYLGMLGVLCSVERNNEPLIYTTNTYYLRKGGDLYRQFREFDPQQHYDAVFMGASKCYHSYNPDFFAGNGLKVFNFGTNVQSIHNSYEIMRYYLNDKNCGHIFLEVTDHLFSDLAGKPIESELNLIMNSNNDRFALQAFMDQPDVRLLNSFLARKAQFRIAPSPSSKNYGHDGYRGISDTVSSRECDFIMSNRETPNLNWSEERIAKLEIFLEYAKAHNIEVTGISGPMTETISETRIAHFVETMSALFAKHGSHFWNYTRIPAIRSCEHFYDYTHLNKAGAKIYEQTIIDRVHEELKK